MTLYTQAESNIRKTWFLITGFLIFIIAMGWLFSYLLDNQIFLILAIIFAVFQSFVSFWYSDKIVLSMTGAFPVDRKDNPELYRIVENLAITAGLPTPKIFLTNESQPNAFTTGRDADHAVMVFNRGLLERLDRTELEGVIAHEFSHIGNKDMLLGTVIVILVGIVATLSNWFLRISFWGGGKRRDEEEGNLAAVLAILGIIGAILAPIVATLIQLAISRKREFLADTDGAFLTRYPEGLARALGKIAQDKTPLRRADTSTAHLYIANPFKKDHWLVNLFSTHPPIEERIKALREMEI